MDALTTDDWLYWKHLQSWGAESMNKLHNKSNTIHVHRKIAKIAWQNRPLPQGHGRITMLLLFNCWILYGRCLPSHSLLIIIGITSPTHSFIPGLNPPFSANPYHRGLSLFLFRIDYMDSKTAYCYFSAHPFLTRDAMPWAYVRPCPCLRLSQVGVLLKRQM